MCWYTTICYFGTKQNKVNLTKKISYNNWQKFVNNNIKTRFSSFSISKNIGYWNRTKEVTHTLTLIHKNDPKIMEDLINIAKEYNLLYNQDEIIINTTKSENFIEVSKI
tara:strand:- start:305 stop:631 length:327 start_codon:yes stop_codon:yes gene_type:complete